jgi:hypothetical protein
MRAVTDLARLEHAATKRLAILEARLRKCHMPPTSADERDIALCVIDAQSTWSQFVRHFFVSCVLGARRISGSRTTVTVGGLHTPDDVIKFAVHAIKPSKKTKKALGPLDEPPWHKGWVLLRLAPLVGLSNGVQVVSAFSIPARALDDLTIARNFFAHRSRGTAAELQALAPRYGLASSTRAGVLPGYPDPKRPYSIAAGWLAELRAIVRHIAV